MKPLASGVVVREGVATAEECLRRSDIAMYAAKRAGRNRQVWFDDRMEQELLERTRLEDEIRDAIAKGEFVPFYQPQMDLVTGQLTGFEVLARWHSPAKGLIEPIDFIGVAEGSGLIAELSLSVMKQALCEARDWPSHLKIAVNISPRRHGSMVELVSDWRLSTRTQLRCRRVRRPRHPEPVAARWLYRFRLCCPSQPRCVVCLRLAAPCRILD